MAQCKAHSRNGAQCRKPSIIGATVCRNHGGAAPQVREAARLRILAMVDPALAQLRRLIDTADTDNVKLSAIKDVLDRAGFDPRQRIEHRLVDGEGKDRGLNLASVREYMRGAPDEGETTL